MLIGTYGRVRVHVYDAFEESKHPRKHGQFAKKGGGETPAKKPATGSLYKEFAGVNEWLRGDRSAAAGSEKENKATIREMDELIAGNKLKEPKTLWRGFGDVNVSDLLNDRGILRDPAYFSTSADRNTAQELAGEGYTAKIEAPAGMPAFEYDPDDPQQEVVLPRGQRFKLVGANHSERVLTFRPILKTDDDVDDAAEFKEGEHPRGKSGQWTKQEGGHSSKIEMYDPRDLTRTEEHNESSEPLIEKIMEHVKAGGSLPAIQVVKEVGKTWILNGHHRYEAAKRLGMKIGVQHKPKKKASSEDEETDTTDALEFDFPIPLDPDLAALARGKQYNIVQEIFRIQAERERSRHPGSLFGDAFQESKVKRVKGGPEGGEFTSKGGGEGGGTKKPQKEFKVTAVTAHLVKAPLNRALWPPHIRDRKPPVPPAWTNIYISPNPKENLWVKGLDSKNRWQPIYNPKFRDDKDAGKFERILRLEARLEEFMSDNDKRLGSKDRREREHAVCLGLIKETGIRPGSERDTGAEVQAYGATTLTGQNVVKRNGKVVLEFTGKKGKDLVIPIEDTVIAHQIAARAKAVGPRGLMFPSVDEHSLRDYSKSVTKGIATPKDFRTLLASQIANDMVYSMEKPTNDREYKKAVNEVAKAVSERLGNTPKIALKSYIPPSVFAQWQ